MSTIHRDHREFEVEAVTPNRVYLRDTFNGAELDMSRDQFEKERIEGKIVVK